MIRKIIVFFYVILILALAIYAASITKHYTSNNLMIEVLDKFTNTGATNAVTAVYLDFRIFDTLFETFLLLVATLGLSQFLRLEQTERIHIEAEINDDYIHSSIASGALHLMMPLFLVFGITISIFGPTSPGGGFQGGAILAVLVMALYLTERRINISLLFFTSLEKILYILFLLLVGLYFLLYTNSTHLHRFMYLIVSNILICFKVFMGLIIIFLRLIGKSQHRTIGDAYE